MLEGYSYEESWPNSIEKYSLKYLAGNNRDLSTLNGLSSKTI